jgi:hypothetical protein
MQKQVEAFGAVIKQASEVTSLEKRPDSSITVTCDDDQYRAL